MNDKERVILTRELSGYIEEWLNRSELYLKDGFEQEADACMMIVNGLLRLENLTLKRKVAFAALKKSNTTNQLKTYKHEMDLEFDCFCKMT